MFEPFHLVTKQFPSTLTKNLIVTNRLPRQNFPWLQQLVFPGRELASVGGQFLPRLSGAAIELDTDC